MAVLICRTKFKKNAVPKIQGTSFEVRFKVHFTVHVLWQKFCSTSFEVHFMAQVSEHISWHKFYSTCFEVQVSWHTSHGTFCEHKFHRYKFWGMFCGTFHRYKFWGMSFVEHVPRYMFRWYKFRRYILHGHVHEVQVLRYKLQDRIFLTVKHLVTKWHLM